MKKHLLLAVMLSMSTLVACGGSDDKKAPDTKPAAATSAPAAVAPAQTPAPTPAPAAQTPAPAPTPVEVSGPMGDLIKVACTCTTAECGSKAMSDLVGLSTGGTAINLQGPEMAQLSQCIMASGIDKNEFISKMRQLRQ